MRLGSLTREFDVLIKRAMRHGRLDIEELVDCYLQIWPAEHPHADNPRKVDIATLIRLIETLPREIFYAPQVHLVADLQRMQHTPLATAAGLRTGLLADDTVLIEACLGSSSVLHLACHLCALQHEVDKALQLFPADDGGGVDNSVSETPDIAADTDDIDEAAEDASQDGTLSIEKNRVADDPLVDFTALALAWGSDTHTLYEADHITDGLLLNLLRGFVRLGPITIHVNLSPQVVIKEAQCRAERIAASMAEMGFLHRPVHVWLGHPIISDCLSPYARDLRQPLQRFWELSKPACGEDIRYHEGSHGEDFIYALAADFLRAQPDMLEERHLADRSVGLLRESVDGLTYEMIDLARIDMAAVDARLAHCHFAPPAPVILRLQPPANDGAAQLIEALIELIGPAIERLTILSEGNVLQGMPGSIVLPSMLLSWVGLQKLVPATPATLRRDEFYSHLDAAAQTGVVLSAPSAYLLSPETMQRLRKTYDIVGVQVADGGLLPVIEDAVHRGVVAPSINIAWGLVATQQTATGRATLQSLSGLSAFAIVRLLQQSYRPLTDPVVKEYAAPHETHQKPSHRAIRLKV